MHEAEYFVSGQIREGGPEYFSRLSLASVGGQIQGHESIEQRTANTCTGAIGAFGVLESYKVLLNASLSPSTRKIYDKALSALETFTTTVTNLTYTLPCSVAHIALFVAYLHHNGFAPKTISTYLSAVAYAHKIRNFQDPTDGFLIRKLVAGAYRLRPAYDLRLPITIPVLNKLIQSLVHTTASRYDYVLFRAMFLFAFESFARVGEITSNGSNAHRVIQFCDVKFLSAGEGLLVEVTFRHFKHNLSKHPHKISFGRGYACFSAIDAIQEYVRMRGSFSGPLFCSVIGKPISRATVDQQLHRSLSFSNLDTSRYKGHSFRIGSASHKAEIGYFDAMIRALGRWNSNAFRKYIRVHSA